MRDRWWRSSVRQHPDWAWIGVAMGVVVFLAIAGGLFIGLSAPIIVVLVAAVGLVAWGLLAVRRRGHRLPVRLGPGSAAVHIGVASVIAFALLQPVPYGRSHSNPSTTGEPAWSSPRTRELMVRACYACHSNKVDWPWYSNIAPFSWALTEHVKEGRSAINYSEFASRRRQSDETIEVIKERSMPPAYFTRFGLHAEAKLTDAEIAELIAGLRATPGLGD